MTTPADIGVYGLGTMGSALALNLAEKGFRVAVANREADWLEPFLKRAGPLAAGIDAHDDLAGFVAGIAAPRSILFMIPAGAPMDAMIDRIRPLLSAGDVLIDGGNADFHDTRRRSEALADSGLHYVGMGVSGGQEGARYGPSMMVGGSSHSWARLRPMAEAIAAHHEGVPCVAHLGPDGAGHFVKTVHNGIEYADMQIIAETYGLMRDGAGRDAGRIGAVFEGWNSGLGAGFLIELTGRVLAVGDPETGSAMVDSILDAAGQKGTGRWTVIEAQRLGQSATVIEAAVAARSWSADPGLRRIAAGLLPGPVADAPAFPGDDTLEQALLAARILGHAQGFGVLQAASRAYDWNLDPARIAEIWRAGCIIRSALLDRFAAAFRADPPGGQPILAPALNGLLDRAVPALRQVVLWAVAAGLPVPALAAALAWHDSLRQTRGTANLIQAQRDAFGAHGFARMDRPGQHHADWT